jgi:prefoldin subunit 5
MVVTIRVILLSSRHLFHEPSSSLSFAHNFANQPFNSVSKSRQVKMKLSTIIVASLGAVSVKAAYNRLPKWCAHIGQGCYMAKRSADASWEVKRSADALAEAMAVSFPSDLPKWCGHIGQGCAKAKRAISAADEVKRSADALAEAIAELEAHEEEA